MIVYEVNISVEATISEAFAGWLATHIEEMLKFDGFMQATWFEAEEPPEGRLLWVIQYAVKTRTALEEYFQTHAAQMRNDGLQQFGTHFTASRRILKQRAI